jgi:YD repeat-containing protein
VIISSSATWPQGSYSLDSLTVNSGATLTIAGGSTLAVTGAVDVTANSSIVLQSANNSAQVNNLWSGVGVTITAATVEVDAGSTINADGQGYTGTCTSPGNGPGGGLNSAGGGSYGGVGGQNTATSVYGSQSAPVDLGSAGAGGVPFPGACSGGGNGGGAIRLVSTGSLTNNGVISANGNSSGPAGGGAGGSVYVTTASLSGNGTFTANGGTGVYGGGGGRVAVYYTSSTFTGYTTSTTKGGADSGDTSSGGTGTVVFINSSNSGGNLYIYQPFTISPGTIATYNSITVSNGATLTIGGGSSVTLTGALTVTGNSAVVAQSANSSAQVNGLWAGVGVTINAASIQVDTGSSISADGQGYTASCTSPGNGPGGGVNSASGGSYGGVGAQNAPTSLYGSQFQPLDLGSAGGGGVPWPGGCWAGGNGGGAGGSLYLTANTVAGSGVFTANGGTGVNGAGGGAGGRIAVFYINDSGVTPASLSAAGGTPSGGAGSMLLSNTPQYLWLKPASNIFHDTVALQWTADAVDLTSTTTDVVIAGKDSLSLATGLFPISSMSWDTTTVADSRYDLQLVYSNASGTVLTQLPRNILLNNSLAWHSGTLQSNQTWTADRVNGVDDDVIVPSGITLTISPGTIVKVAAGVKIVVQDGGVVNAQGTATQKVIFTTLEDDSVGGDSNLDGSDSVPTPGEWPGVTTQGSGQFNTNANTEVLYVVAGEAAGIIANQTWVGSQLYHITSTVTIPSGVTLTIQAGAIIKFDPGTSLVVGPGGNLVAQGTVAQPIYFTSIKDDSIGGDTNRDGNATSPAPGDWLQIYVDDQATATLDHVVMSYGAGNPNSWDAMFRTNGSPTVNIFNSIIRQSLYDGILTMGGTLSLTNSIVTTADRGVNAQGNSVVQVRNSTIDSNNTGVFAHGGTVTVTNSIVSNQTSIGINVCCSSPTPTVTYSDFWSPAANAINYNAMPDPTGQSGNKSADPLFRNQPQGDYRLNYLSPAIDAANGEVAPVSDMTGASRYTDPRTTNPTGVPAANGAYPDMGPYEFVETATSDIDFIVASVNGPVTAMAGDSASIAWTITNVGSGSAVGPWHDAVYLVRDPDTNPVKIFAAEVISGLGVTLGPGQSYQGSAIIRVPGSVVGNHRWEVKTNTRGEIFEGQNTNNNTGISLNDVFLDLPQLVPGASPMPYTFATIGQSWWYKLTATAGQAVETDLALSGGASGSVQLFIGQGYLPTPSNSDFQQSQFDSPVVSAVIPNISTQTYYVTAYAQSLAGSSVPFTIAAKTLPFSLNSVNPTSVGNGGAATIEFIGAQLNSAATYQITSPDGTPHSASSVNVQDEGHVFATFSMVGWPTGTYSASVTENSATVSLADAVAVSAGTSLAANSGPIQYTQDVPPSLRAGYGSVVTIHYQNISSDDVAAPLMWLTADTASLGLIPPACSGCSSNFPAQYQNSAAAGYLLGINQSGPAGILPAGASGTLTLSMLSNTGSSVTNFTLLSVTQPDDIIDWPSAQSSLQPPYVPDDAWAAIYSNFMANVGTTAGQYNVALAQDATYFSQQGKYEYRSSVLFAYEIEKAGLTEITRRYTVGAMGRGMSHPFDIWADVGASGFVIHYPVGKVRAFSMDPTTANHYIGATGDYGSLNLNPNDGTWYLTEHDGKIFHFIPNPYTAGHYLLDYIKDLNGYQMSMAYTGSQLTSMTDSNNDTLALAYNSQGLLTQMTDQVGRTTTYTYDSTGNHLLTMTNAKGTTTLTWITGLGAAVEHAISSIGYTDGSHTYYEYDAQGRVVHIYRDGNLNSRTIAYDSSGGATITDANGSSYSLAFSEVGQIAQLTDPLGAVRQIGTDPEDKYSSYIAPDGSASFASYDGQGNPSGIRDQLGNELSASYGTNGSMQSFSDRLGNPTSFTRDANQNVIAITYADGSTEQVTRDTRGLLSSWTNRRGHQVTITHDAKGLLTQKTYADGTQISYAYDAHRNLTGTTVTGSATTYVRSGRAVRRMQLRPQAIESTATPNGATTYTYDSADRVTSIRNPSGTSLQYTYNANGQRASMTDQAGNTVNYAYDQTGRLSQLTNASHALIVSYTYDASGKISRKNLGNGAYATYAYDAAGQLLHLVNYSPSGAVSSRYDYTYDSNGRKLSMSTLNGQWTYQYDAKGQVVAENLPNGSSILYTYDAVGNRISANYYGRSTQYNVNNLNQYTSATSSSFTYDADGNMTSKVDATGATAYSYDDDGNMMSATTASGTTSYDYDAFGNLAGQASAGASAQYLNDLGAIAGSAAQLAGITDSAGNATQVVQGLEPAALVAAGGNSDYYQTDSTPQNAQGNVVQLTGPSGNVLDNYTYNNEGVQSSSVTTPQPFDYQSTVDMGNNTNATGSNVYSQQMGRAFQPSTLDPNAEPYNPHFADPENHVASSYSWETTSNTIEATGAMPLATIEHGLLQEQAPAFQTLVQQWYHGTAGHSVDVFKETSGSRFVKGVGTFTSVVGMGTDSVNLVTTIAKGDGWGSLHNGGFVVLDYLAIAQPEIFVPVQQVAVGLDFVTQKYANWLYGVDQQVPEVWKAYRQASFAQTNHPASGDPNGKLTVGFGDQGFIPPNTPITYTIYFENQPTATAPAEKVVVTDPLDTNLDLSSVRLTQIAFNGVTLNLPANLQTYSIQTNVSTDRNPVTVNASLDPSSGVLTWTIQSVDPATGTLPADPLAGFLPPDDSSHRGEGSLTFTVMPKSGLADGTTITNTASIIFDLNFAIATNTVTNTIDSTYPTSAVNPLPAVTTTPTFTVSWSGSDPSGSGIQSYDIWVAVDSAPYALWLPATTQTSAAYSGSIGHTYSFYSLATSNSGRKQQAPAAAANTRVSSTQPSQILLTASANSVNFGVAITFTATVSATTSGGKTPAGTITFLDGASSLGTGTLNATGIATFSLATLASGQHSITANYGGDGNYSASSSAAVSVTVNAADFSLTASSSAITVPRGSSAAMALTIAPQGVFNQAITFACANLPAGVTCSFTPSSLTPNSTTSTVTLTLSASKSVARERQRALPWRTGTLFVASLLGLTFGRSRRSSLALALVTIAIAAAMFAVACGGGSAPPPVISIVQVSATSPSAQHSVNVTVTVQ